MVNDHSIEIAALLTTANASPSINGFFKAIRPLVADVNDDVPLLTYRLSEQPYPSKNSALHEYILTINVVATKYNDSTRGAQLLQQWIRDNHAHIKFTGSDSAYIHEQKIAVTDINFNLKMD